MRFFKSRAQADAPVELVIGVIILIASMTIALSIMKQTEQTQCLSQVKGEVQKLQLAMQDLSLQSPPSSRKVYFNMPSCGSASVDVVRFVHYNDAAFCRECPGRFGGCWKIELASYIPAGTAGSSEKFQTLPDVSLCADVSGTIYLKDMSAGASTTNIGYASASYDAGKDASCRTASGIPKAVFDTTGSTSNLKSNWLTLGRKGGRTYLIEMKKDTITCSNVGECGAISICAKDCATVNCN